MAGMNDMMADILKKIIPREVMDMLTPEKISELGEKVNAVVQDIRDRFDRIEATQNAIVDRITLIEEKSDGGSNSVNGRVRKPRVGSSGPSAEPGTGTSN